MTKLTALLLCMLLLTGCTAANQPSVPLSSLPTDSVMCIPFLSEFRSSDVQSILYYDNSQPPQTPAHTYTDAQEIERILVMLEDIQLTQALQQCPGTAPGDYGSYKILLNDGRTYYIGRSGNALSYGDQWYAYTGRFARQLHIDEVIIEAACSMGYPANGKIKLVIRAFDEDHTAIVQSPVLKQFDGNRWTVVEHQNPGSGVPIPLSDFLPDIDLKSDYPQLTTGDFKITYEVVLPTGETTFVTAPFTIFDP